MEVWLSGCLVCDLSSRGLVYGGLVAVCLVCDLSSRGLVYGGLVAVCLCVHGSVSVCLFVG
jgi:hypothetical protein